MTNKLDYHRPIPMLPWYRSDLLTVPISIAAIVGVNVWLVWHADKSWGLWLWMILFIPLANAALAAILLACSPLVRLITGMSASLHVWTTLVGCTLAIGVDIALIFR